VQRVSYRVSGLVVRHDERVLLLGQPTPIPWHELGSSPRSSIGSTRASASLKARIT
jgi:hypothetical protein